MEQKTILLKKIGHVISCGILAGSLGCGNSPEKEEQTGQINSPYSGKNFYYFDAEDRTTMFENLVQAAKTKYSGWNIKQHLTDVNPQETADQYRRKLLEISEATDVFEEAEGNMKFLDLITAYIAAFQDAHLKLRLTHPRPKISNGIELKQLKNKTILAKIAPKLLARSLEKDICKPSDEPYSCLLYAEVMEIDHQQPIDAAQKTMPYISSGTPKNRLKWAIQALSTRSFSYPTVPKSTYKLALADGRIKKVELPFYFSSKNPRTDAKFYLKHQGFGSLDFAFETWNESKGEWVPDQSVFTGWDRYASLHEMLPTAFYLGKEDQDPILRVGYIFKNGKAYGVMQIFGFYEEQIFKETDTDEENPKSFVEVVQGFLKNLENKKLPLILDLRHNPGGSGTNVKGLIKALTPTSSKLEGAYSSIAITRSNRQMFEQMQEWPWQRETQRQEMKNLQVALEQNLPYSPLANAYGFETLDFQAFQEEEVEPIGFNQKIVAFISHECISACELTSIVLQQNQRAYFIGTPTQGTGMGFRSINHYTSNIWKYVDLFSTFHVTFPNALFGFAPESTEDTIFGTTTENRPVLPDMMYEETLQDIKNSSQELLNIALDQLSD